MLGSTPPTNIDPYLVPRPKGEPKVLPKPGILRSLEELPQPNNMDDLPPPDKTKFLYHVNKVTGIYHLCIPPSVALDILAIAHEERHLGFSCCYKIIAHSWFIQGLTKLLQAFIHHCFQCLALQTRRHVPYGSLQRIKSPPVPFFTLTLDFVLTLPVSANEYNTLMLITCKFSKRITLIEGVDTWSAKQWAHAFFKRLDLLNWGLPGELITDHNPKFLSAF